MNFQFKSVVTFFYGRCVWTCMQVPNEHRERIVESIVKAARADIGHVWDEGVEIDDYRCNTETNTDLEIQLRGEYVRIKPILEAVRDDDNFTIAAFAANTTTPSSDPFLLVDLEYHPNEPRVWSDE